MLTSYKATKTLYREQDNFAVASLTGRGVGVGGGAIAVLPLTDHVPIWGYGFQVDLVEMGYFAVLPDNSERGMVLA